MRRFFFMTSIKHALFSLAWIPVLLLAACHASPPREPNDQEVTRAEALRPADAQLAAKYERACLACHGVRSAAPLTGFEPAWAPRVARANARRVEALGVGISGRLAYGADVSWDCWIFGGL